MRKSLVLIIATLLSSGIYSSAQDVLSNGKSFNFPTKKYGISIGNSYEFNGLRINFADKNVNQINGVNITFWLKKLPNEEAIVNGLSLGVFPVAGKMQPFNIGLIGVGTSNQNLNGLSFGGLFIGAGGKINGFAMSGLMLIADGDSSSISGIAISGISIGTRNTINGLAIGGLVVVSDGDINGIASSLAFISSGKSIEGIAVTCGYLKSEIFKGIAVAGYAYPHKMSGLSLAVVNRTKELHGIQFGLFNYAGNNPKWLRAIPLINFHF